MSKKPIDLLKIPVSQMTPEQRLEANKQIESRANVLLAAPLMFKALELIENESALEYLPDDTQMRIKQALRAARGLSYVEFD